MNETRPVRVLVVDDDSLIRAGLCTVLRSDDTLEIVGEAENGYRGIELAQRLEPDVILMDIRMPQLDGLAALELLQNQASTAKVLVLTTFGEEEYIDRALSAGASGFMLKSSSPLELIGGVHAVAQGAATLSPRIAQRVVERIRGIDTGASSTAAALVATLTGREREVLTLLGSGSSNAEIAAHMVITEATVKGYVTAILVKLGARNRVEAALIAFQAGLKANTEPR
ncbi:response regulator [Glutamicibacter soli]|uniref:Response regulator n=1 Tax=Glutamicibacter soli TaxID=453836 RepID=A0A6L9G4S4_9MICC|nr:response regulator transcription factor [Glutamicibacter soli]NAZ16751.1 response regulator [Glutamicibacter soli]